MKTVNMHEAKTHLSKLVAGAVAGEPFVIALAGKPMVKVTPIEEEPKAKPQRLGFMIGQLNVPDDFFDPALDKEIEQLFYGEIE
jgi:prevent-host-death family protein